MNPEQIGILAGRGEKQLVEEITSLLALGGASAYWIEAPTGTSPPETSPTQLLPDGLAPRGGAAARVAQIAGAQVLITSLHACAHAPTRAVLVLSGGQNPPPFWSATVLRLPADGSVLVSIGAHLPRSVGKNAGQLQNLPEASAGRVPVIVRGLAGGCGASTAAFCLALAALNSTGTSVDAGMDANRGTSATQASLTRPVALVDLSQTAATSPYLPLVREGIGWQELAQANGGIVPTRLGALLGKHRGMSFLTADANKVGAACVNATLRALEEAGFQLVIDAGVMPHLGLENYLGTTRFHHIALGRQDLRSLRGLAQARIEPFGLSQVLIVRGSGPVPYHEFLRLAGQIKARPWPGGGARATLLAGGGLDAAWGREGKYWAGALVRAAREAWSEVQKTHLTWGDTEAVGGSNGRVAPERYGAAS